MNTNKCKIIIEDRFRHFIDFFNIIADYQDKLFDSYLDNIIKINIDERGPICIYNMPYDEMRHNIYLAIGPRYPYQAAYQFSHEYSHIKMKFWKTYGVKEYYFKFFEEALAYCASIITMRYLSSAQDKSIDLVMKRVDIDEYATNETNKVVPFLPSSMPEWLKNNFPDPLASDFCCGSGQEYERERSKILGYHLIKYEYLEGFWKAASVLTEACSVNHESYPEPIEEFFDRWIRVCAPDAAKAVTAVRESLLSTSQEGQGS